MNAKLLIPAGFERRRFDCNKQNAAHCLQMSSKLIDDDKNNERCFFKLHLLPESFSLSHFASNTFPAKEKCRGGEMSQRNGSQTHARSGQESTKAERGWKVVARRQSRQVTRKRKEPLAGFLLQVRRRGALATIRGRLQLQTAESLTFLHT